MPRENGKQETIQKESKDVECISPIKVHPVSLSEIESRCERIKQNLAVSDEDITRIEAETRNQSADNAWFKHRKYRITASKAYRCAVLKDSTSPSKAIQEVLGYNTVHATKQMKEGLRQEQAIMDKYIREKNKNCNSNVTVERCGFFVSKTHSFLGASPDGIVCDPEANGETTGLIEMKYIQTLDSETLEDALLRKGICVLKENNITVNTKHKYYFQIHQQMFVTGKKWEDFVVQGSNSDGIYIERVKFDSEFWNGILPKLELFFNNHILPEIAYPTIKYHLPSHG